MTEIELLIQITGDLSKIRQAVIGLGIAIVILALLLSEPR